MRKTSGTDVKPIGKPPRASDIRDTGPGRIRGATVTSWPGAVDVDLMAFLSNATLETTITGSSSGSATPQVSSGKTVALSDGSQITFATAEAYSPAE
jgi:hypothetical protein